MNAETAYQTLANYLSNIVNLNHWDKLVLEADIADSMVKSVCYGLKSDERFNNLNRLNPSAAADMKKALFFLRDNIKETTGERVWTINFELLSNRKFNINYSYEKPDWLG